MLVIIVCVLGLSDYQDTSMATENKVSIGALSISVVAKRLLASAL